MPARQVKVEPFAQRKQQRTPQAVADLDRRGTISKAAEKALFCCHVDSAAKRPARAVSAGKRKETHQGLTERMATSAFVDDSRALTQVLPTNFVRAGRCWRLNYLVTFRTP